MDVRRDVKVAMVIISVSLIVWREKSTPNGHICNLEESLGTFKALDHNAHFF